MPFELYLNKMTLQQIKLKRKSYMAVDLSYDITLKNYIIKERYY